MPGAFNIFRPHVSPPTEINRRLTSYWAVDNSQTSRVPLSRPRWEPRQRRCLAAFGYCGGLEYSPRFSPDPPFLQPGMAPAPKVKGGAVVVGCLSKTSVLLSESTVWRLNRQLRAPCLGTLDDGLMRLVPSPCDLGNMGIYRRIADQTRPLFSRDLLRPPIGTA